MEKLSEHDVALSFIGKILSFDRLNKVFKKCGFSYTANCSDFDEDLCKKFKITHALQEKWMYSGIDFRIEIKTSATKDQIGDCSIFKYKDPSGGSCGRPQGGDASPTQQEIKIFDRIMAYVTMREEMKKFALHQAQWQFIYVNADSENMKLSDLKSGDIVSLTGVVKKSKGKIYIDNCKCVITDCIER